MNRSSCACGRCAWSFRVPSHRTAKSHENLNFTKPGVYQRQALFFVYSRIFCNAAIRQRFLYAIEKHARSNYHDTYKKRDSHFIGNLFFCAHFRRFKPTACYKKYSFCNAKNTVLLLTSID